jgi:hypothetical protein
MRFSRIEPPRILEQSQIECCISQVIIEHSVWEISDLKRTKFDDKSKKYVFIGYSEKSKAYKLYDPIEKKFMISRDIELNKESHWD